MLRTKQDLFNRPMNVDATSTAKMMLWSLKGMPQPESNGSGSNCSHMDMQRVPHSAIKRSCLHVSKQTLEEETVEIDWSDKDAMRQLEDKWAMHSEWCHATLNDLLAGENTEVAMFIRDCRYAEVDSCSGGAEIDWTPEGCNKRYIAIWRQFNDQMSGFVTNSSHWDKDYMRKNRLWSHVGT